jgi:hypothetical protein
MIPIILKILIVLFPILFYIIGELYKKEFKYAMGILPAILATMLTVFSSFTLFPMWAIITYFIAGEIGYGDRNPLTLIVGKRAAIVIHGSAVGFASYPFIGLWCLIGGIVSGIGFYFIAKWDDENWFKEPFVAIGRSMVGMIVVAIYYLIDTLMKGII